jgi:hypothetical protein
LKTRRMGKLLPALAASALLALASAGAAVAKPYHSSLRSHAGAAHRAHRSASVTPAASAAALDWYDITNNTVTAAAFPQPVTGSDVWDDAWLAAARAVQRGRGDSFQIAALAQSVHDALVALVPSQQTTLDTDLAATLASLPDGLAKSRGIATGHAEAASVLAQRANDGLDTTSVDIPFTPPPPAPGIWQPTPPAFSPATRAGQGNAESFLLRANNQFDPGPPPSLTSRTYRRDVAEVEAFGTATDSLRTQAQTNVALFWEPAANIQYIQIVRALIADEHGSLAWDTRFVAAFQIITTDAQISIYNAKYKYIRWRPVTAIQEGSPGVPAVPGFTPLFTTPTYPEYPSGHGGYAGAAQQVLDAFVGPQPPEAITVTSPNDPGVPQVYSDWATVTQQVVNARVWEGIHFRFSDVTGANQGAKVARWDLARLPRLGL